MYLEYDCHCCVVCVGVQNVNNYLVRFVVSHYVLWPCRLGFAFTMQVDLNIFNILHAIQVVERACLSRGMDLDWISDLADALENRSAASEVLRGILIHHGWEGTQFRGVPRLEELLAELRAVGYCRFVPQATMFQKHAIPQANRI